VFRLIQYGVAEHSASHNAVSVLNELTYHHIHLMPLLQDATFILS
jgi:hypothetical protein